MSPEQNVSDEIQHAVLSYLDDHPSATGSIEMIQRWWLLERMARLTQTEVSKALEALVSNQLVSRNVLGDGREVYFRRGDMTLNPKMN